MEKVAALVEGQMFNGLGYFAGDIEERMKRGAQADFEARKAEFTMEKKIREMEKKFDQMKEAIDEARQGS